MRLGRAQLLHKGVLPFLRLGYSIPFLQMVLTAELIDVLVKISFRQTCPNCLSCHVPGSVMRPAVSRGSPHYIMLFVSTTIYKNINFYVYIYKKILNLVLF